MRLAPDSQQLLRVIDSIDPSSGQVMAYLAGGSVAFTGPTAVGQAIVRAAARTS